MFSTGSSTTTVYLLGTMQKSLFLTMHNAGVNIYFIDCGLFQNKYKISSFMYDIFIGLGVSGTNIYCFKVATFF